MAKLRMTTQGLLWWCPGCKDAHPARGWTFDGNMESPTFAPSFLTRGDDGTVCHCFVEKGMVRFRIEDTTHELKGQTVPLPDWPALPPSYWPEAPHG